MAIVPAIYPNNIWNGLSSNPYRPNRESNVCPDYRDWDQVVAEIVAIQNNMSSESVQLTVDTTIVSGGTDGLLITVENGAIAQLMKAPAIANTNAATLVELEDEVNKIKELLRLQNIMEP